MGREPPGWCRAPCPRLCCRLGQADGTAAAARGYLGEVDGHLTVCGVGVCIAECKSLYFCVRFQICHNLVHPPRRELIRHLYVDGLN